MTHKINVDVKENHKADLCISDYAKDAQYMTKQELSNVYGTLMDDIHSGKINTKEKENNIMKGTVKWFDNKKGYGFIAGDDGKDYFVHYSKISTKGFKFLIPEQEVMFNIEKADDKVQAINVKPIRKKKGDKND